MDDIPRGAQQFCHYIWAKTRRWSVEQFTALYHTHRNLFYQTYTLNGNTFSVLSHISYHTCDVKEWLVRLSPALPTGDRLGLGNMRGMCTNGVLFYHTHLCTNTCACVCSQDGRELSTCRGAAMCVAKH